PSGLPGASLARGAVTAGRAFPVSEVSVAAGYVWVSGDLGSAAYQPVLYQVSPATLTVLHSWRPAARTKVYADVAVTTGPGGTAWATARHLLWRRGTPRGGGGRAGAGGPPGRAAPAGATDPSRRYLYVSGMNADGGTTALEYTAGSGTLLASAARTPLRYSVHGVALTAVPGGV